MWSTIEGLGPDTVLILAGVALWFGSIFFVNGLLFMADFGATRLAALEEALKDAVAAQQDSDTDGQTTSDEVSASWTALRDKALRAGKALRRAVAGSITTAVLSLFLGIIVVPTVGARFVLEICAVALIASAIPSALGCILWIMFLDDCDRLKKNIEALRPGPVPIKQKFSAMLRGSD